MLRISVSHPLPRRPRALAVDELSRVFGGCLKYYVSCVKDADCCENTARYGCVGGVCSERRTVLTRRSNSSLTKVEERLVLEDSMRSGVCGTRPQPLSRDAERARASVSSPARAV